MPPIQPVGPKPTLAPGADDPAVALGHQQLPVRALGHGGVDRRRAQDEAERVADDPQRGLVVGWRRGADQHAADPSVRRLTTRLRAVLPDGSGVRAARAKCPSRARSVAVRFATSWIEGPAEPNREREGEDKDVVGLEGSALRPRSSRRSSPPVRSAQAAKPKPDLSVSKAAEQRSHGRAGRPADAHLDGQERRSRRGREVHDGARALDRRQARRARPAPRHGRPEGDQGAQDRDRDADRDGARERRRAPLHAAGLRRRAEQGQGELGAQQLPRGRRARRHRAARRHRRPRRPVAARAGSRCRSRSRRPAADRDAPTATATEPAAPGALDDDAHRRAPATSRQRRARRFALHRQPSPARPSSAGSTTRAFAPCTLAEGLSERARRRARLRGPRQEPAGALDPTPARKAWRIEFEAPAPGPTAAPRPPPETEGHARARRRGHARLRRHRVPLHRRRPDPEGRRRRTRSSRCSAAVLRGRVMRRNGSPIEGVQVTVLDHPELGRTATRTDGGFDIAVNGGGSVTLAFERAGYIPSQRQLEVPTQDYERVEEIVMVPYEDRVSGVDLADDELQVAQGSTITDGDGTRQATLLLEPGTDATATLPDGTEKDARRPPEHPRHRVHDRRHRPGRDAGRAAADLGLHLRRRVLRRRGQRRTRPSTSQFDKPVVTYVDNMLGFPAGTAVPMGYYDREQGAVDRGQGRRSSSSSSSEAGGRAQLDVTGDGVADTGAKLTDARHRRRRAAQARRALRPRQEPLARRDHALHAVGLQLALRPARRRRRPRPGRPGRRRPDGDDPCDAGRLDHPLREPGARRAVRRSPARRTRSSTSPTASPAAAPATRSRSRSRARRRPPSMARVDLTIEVAGRTIKQSFARAGEPLVRRSPSTAWTPTGAACRAARRSTSRSTTSTPRSTARRTTFQSSFAAIGGAPLSTNSTRTEIAVGQQWSGVVGDGLQAPAAALAGWSVDVHHTYDPVGRTLYLGDGTKRSAEGQNFDVIATTKSGLAAPEGMAKTADGALLVADAAAHVVRRVVPGGATTIVAGALGTAGFSGDGGAATDGRARPPRRRRGRPRRRDLRRRRGQQPRPPDRPRRQDHHDRRHRRGRLRRRRRPRAAARRSTSRPTSPSTRAAPCCVVDSRQQRGPPDRPRRHHRHARRHRHRRLRRRRRRGHRRAAALARATSRCASDGSVFIADSGNNRVRRIDAGRHDHDRRRQRRRRRSAATAGPRPPRTSTRPSAVRRCATAAC